MTFDLEPAPQLSIEDLFVAKREHTARPEWSRAIRDLMASSRHLRTQSALARRSGVTQSTIDRILRSEVDPQSDNLERLAHSFGLSYSTLAAIAEGKESTGTTTVSVQPGKISRYVPLLSMAQVGRFGESVYPDHLSDEIDWIGFPKKRQGPRTIAMRVSGESMEPNYCNGDLIYIDPDVAPIHGRDVVVRLSERYEVILKRLVVEGEHRFLKALNVRWPDPLISMPTEARIVGVVVGRYTDV